MAFIEPMHRNKPNITYGTVGAIWPSLSPCTVINPILLTYLWYCWCHMGFIEPMHRNKPNITYLWYCRCHMAFIEPMHRNKPNITYLLMVL